MASKTNQPSNYFVQILFFGGIAFLMLLGVGCDNGMKPEPHKEPISVDVKLSKDKVTGHETIAQFFSHNYKDDVEGRSRTLAVWTENKDSLAMQFNNKYIWGDENARYIAILSIEPAPNGWQEISRDSTESAWAKEKFEISWWRNPDTLVIADFEIPGSRENNCGGEIGSWNRFPDDPTQGTKEFDGLGIGHDGGNCLGIDYDVDSPNPAANGVYLKLGRTIGEDTYETKDLTPYKYLVLWIKGDATKGFTKKFQIEFKRPKNTNEAEKWDIMEVSSQWKEYRIKLDDFFPWSGSGYSAITDWTTIEELTITFADSEVDPTAKDGVIYIDDIMLLDSLPYSK